MAYTRVIIIGGGFGGLNVAKALASAKIEILLIDKTNHHLFQPLLYEVATAALSPGEVATPIREILRKQDNTTVIMGDVVHINRHKREVTLANGEILVYDYLVVAVGAKHSYFGNDHWEAHAPGLKTISDAIGIREKILVSFEKAERMDRISKASKFLNFVVIGGGPTGVEMAGALAEIAHKTLFKNFRRIQPDKSKIYLIEAFPHILPVYPERLSIRAKEDLEKLGVKVITGKKVTAITEQGVQVEEMFIEAENVIWAAGNQASSLLKTLDVPLDRQGRAVVLPDLTIAGHPELFVIGDAACALGKNGKPLPGTSPVAIQEARYVAKIIESEIPSVERKPFKYFDKGSMATIGKYKAIALIGKLQFTGFFAWLMWCFVHIVYLIGFRNRLSVMIEWAFFLITGQRGARVIYQAIDPKIPHPDEK